MKISISAILPSLFLIMISVSCAKSTFPNYHSFLQCLSVHSSDDHQPIIPIYTPNTSSYSKILLSSLQNLRFLTPTTPKPHLIITPLHESQVQATVICCRKHELQIRIRSGGHDYEGLSYTSYDDTVPFVLLDLFNLQSIDVDVEDGTAWVQAGATIGQLYYRIAEKSPTYGFPAGICPTVGLGGQFSGGGYGYLLRKYGLASDNIIDALIVNVEGKILNKESMGEDLFWAIRGGGGASFGVVLAFKIKLVPVPPIVTVFNVSKTLEGGAIPLVHKWQFIAHELPKDLMLLVRLHNVNATTVASFRSMFLGRTEQLLHIMQQSFPELGLKASDCIEMKWVQSTPYFYNLPLNVSLQVLLNRTLQTKVFTKTKSDYVQEPISETGIRGIWRRFSQVDRPVMILIPFGGRMSEIAPSETPFPHRDGNLYQICYMLDWNEKGAEATRKNIEWMRRLYKYMERYVSKNPRAAYLNYRDIDLGHNNEISDNSTKRYGEAKVWGIKYFKNNFDRLVRVKSKVDVENFFKNEQSIPPKSSMEKDHQQ